MLLEVGISYTGSSLRLPTFISFSFTVDVLITKLKKFFENIDPKNFARDLVLKLMDVMILGLTNVKH